MLGVSFDAPHENAAFADKLGLDHPLLSDLTHEVAVAYGAADAVDAQMARRVGVVVDPDGRVARWLPSVSPRTFPQEALDMIPAP